MRSLSALSARYSALTNMGEIFFTIFLFIAITGVTAVLFGGWVIFSILKLAWRAGSAAEWGHGGAGASDIGGEWSDAGVWE